MNNDFIAYVLGLFRVLLVIIPLDSAIGQGVLVKAAYLNTSYCFGAVEKYAERLASASGSTHRSSAKQAQRYADILKTRAEQLRVRYDYKKSEGDSAIANGSRTMGGLLPMSGAWSNGGDVPGEAYRQYQNCVTLAE